MQIHLDPTHSGDLIIHAGGPDGPKLGEAVGAKTLPREEWRIRWTAGPKTFEEISAVVNALRNADPAMLFPAPLPAAEAQAEPKKGCEPCAASTNASTNSPAPSAPAKP